MRRLLPFKGRDALAPLHLPWDKKLWQLRSAPQWRAKMCFCPPFANKVRNFFAASVWRSFSLSGVATSEVATSQVRALIFLYAAGVALALKLRGEKRAAVCVLGDGATSKGDFYEAINFAGLWRLPLVFVVNNNEWAISVPRSEQSAAATLAQKAIAAGITGEQVDGNDVIGLKARLEKALELARNGNGPILIEALTYRLGDHTTADDARRYRSEEKVSARWKAEPIARLRNFMVAKGFWTKQDEEKLLRECQDEVNEAADRFLQREPQPPVAMFDFLYERLPAALEGQHMMLLKEHESFNQPGRGENG